MTYQKDLLTMGGVIAILAIIGFVVMSGSSPAITTPAAPITQASIKQACADKFAAPGYTNDEHDSLFDCIDRKRVAAGLPMTPDQIQQEEFRAWYAVADRCYEAAKQRGHRYLVSDASGRPDPRNMAFYRDAMPCWHAAGFSCARIHAIQNERNTYCVD
jgi:hypothetical protein